MAGFGTIEAHYERSTLRLVAEHIETSEKFKSERWTKVDQNNYQARLQRVPVGEYWVWLDSVLINVGAIPKTEKEWVVVYENDVTVVDFVP